MGEAKRRKQLDPNFGKASKQGTPGINLSQIRQTAMTKNLIEPVKVLDSKVISVHLMVSFHPDFFNQGFCQIRTEEKLITLWSEKPFKKSGSLLTHDREWSGIFKIQIINGVASECSRQFSMKNIVENQSVLGRNFNSHLNTCFDKFVIDDLISVKTGSDLPPVDIDIQIPSIQYTKIFSLSCNPDYEELTDLYLSKGLAPLQSAIFDWLTENNLIDKDPSDSLSYFNQISMTVLDIASKTSKSLATHDLKVATFTLKVPFELQDYYSYPPVQSQKELAIEAMRLINTGFFDRAITELINIERDSIKNLRQNGIILYMATNNELEICDAACALAKWKPFRVVHYIGEQRNNLDLLIEKTFEPLASKIQDFRIKQKRADKFPCLSMLCIVENKITGSLCEFRRHYTAQSGGQLIIPGFSDGNDGVVSVFMPMDTLGQPRKIPSIRGFNA
jgi:hypothetical protein